MMQEKAEVAVTVLAEKEQAETVLVQMKEIEAFTVESGEETGSIVLHITAKDNADIRKELSVALASAGLPILSMNLSKKSLEDIFLELTGTEESDEEEFDEDESDDERSDDEMDIEEETDDDSNL